MPALTDVERRRIDLLVSPRVGVVRSLQRYRPTRTAPELPVLWTAELSDWDLAGSTDTPAYGVGKGLNSADAIRGALGEAVERYCCGIFDVASMPYDTVANMGLRAVSPADLVLYSERQYVSGEITYPRFSPAQPLHWARGVDLTDGGDAYVPASATYLAYRHELADETWCYNTSNGLAAGADLPSAVLGGLYELIERDAYLITWSHRLAPPRVDFDERTAPAAAAVRAQLRSAGVEVLAFDVCSDLAVPVVLAVAIDRSGRAPAAVIGLGCDLDLATALTKAMLELGQGWIAETSPSRAEAHARVRSAQDVRAIMDHSALFAHPRTLPELDFLLTSPHRRSVLPVDSAAKAPLSPAGKLERVLDELRRIGSRAAYVDVTSSDIAATGLVVVRTVATHLQPIHFGYRCERFGDRRLLDAPAAMDRVPLTHDFEGLNRCPHPLP